MPEVVNVVATGDLNIQINYRDVLDTTDLPHLQYDPDVHQGLELRFIEDGPLITVYASGKYIIRANSLDLLYETREEFLRVMFKISCINEPADEEFNINNIVYTGELGREVDLPALSSDLRLGEVIYEPEKFPALRCRFPDQDCTVMLYRTGKIAVVGADTCEKSQSAYNKFIKVIEGLFEAH